MLQKYLPCIKEYFTVYYLCDYAFPFVAVSMEMV